MIRYILKLTLFFIVMFSWLALLTLAVLSTASVRAPEPSTYNVVWYS